MITKEIPIDELAYEVVRKRLLANLGDRPQSIPCGNDPRHKPRQADAYLLNKGEVRYLECQQCKAVERWANTGIPHRLLAATVSDYKAESPEQVAVKDMISDWVKLHRSKSKKRQTFLLMVGNPGTGKSHMAAAAIKGLKGGWFTSPYEIFKRKSARMDDPKQPDPIERAKRANCLVLDECMVGGDRADAPEVWQDILDHRYDKQSATILCSNQDPESIVEFIGLPGIRDRIKTDSTICQFTWNSFR